MLWKTHISIGLLLGLLTIDYFSPENKALFIIITVISSLLPDIDQGASLINRLFVFSKLFAKFFRHRGFTHSFLATGLGYLLFFLILSPKYASAFAIGYFSHLLADAITIEGVNFFYPLQTRIAGPIRTGSLVENVVLVVVLLVVVGVLVKV